MLPTAATDFYSLQQRINITSANEIRRLWRRMDTANLDASWSRIATPVLAVLVEAQQQVTTAALAYVPAVLEQTDVPDRPRGELKDSALVGVASDGRPLGSLAYGSVVKTGEALTGGATADQALRTGLDWVNLMTRLQVADTARQAVTVQTIARPELSGTVRVLIPPSCQRCTVLAGRVYRWSQGFLRHPRCDCMNMPIQSSGQARADGFVVDPMEAFAAGEIRNLSAAQRAAVAGGTNIDQVVNPLEGMSTTDAVTGRGVPLRSVVTQTTRPTAEAIAAAASDRAAAIAALRTYGYLN